MEKVQITIRQKCLIVRFQKETFKAQWQDWMEKLQQLTLLYQGMPEVFFHFPDLEMEEILECLEAMKLCCKVQGYSNVEESAKHFQIIHQRLRGGNPVRIEAGALILGNVERDVSLVLISGNLYVMGTIRGQIECLDEKSRIFCQAMEEARIGFKGIWQISTKKEGSLLYHKDKQTCEWEEEVWQEVL